MTPPAAATAAPARTLPGRRPAPAVPRRRSGCAHARPLAPRLARTARRVGDARVLDRLVRGRAWIALVAVALMGVVFMQVSLLKLNAGISRAVSGADTLERQNATLRASISELDSGRRVQATAAGLGMVMPAAGDVRFLDAREADARRAAAAIRAPSPTPAAVTAAPSTTTAAPATTTAAPATSATAPATTATQATGAAAQATGAATPATGAATPATGAATPATTAATPAATAATQSAPTTPTPTTAAPTTHTPAPGTTAASAPTAPATASSTATTTVQGTG